MRKVKSPKNRVLKVVLWAAITLITLFALSFIPTLFLKTAGMNRFEDVT